VPTAWIGRTNGWEASGREVELMSADELRELADFGVAVGSHGHAHVDLVDVGPDRAHEDVLQSLDVLDDVLGMRPRYLAYPWGRWSPEIGDVVAAAGFQAAFTIDAPDRGPFARERIGIVETDGPTLFALKSSARYLPLRRLLRRPPMRVKPQVA
jgi:peptidoglycan/xylan/chitin deacetylase (PgdA/CDA1 family)